MAAGATAVSVPPAGEVLIGTHDGAFHCDEVLACTMLRHTKQFENAVIVRSRKPDILKQCNTVVDVGAVYDADKLLFDHHQPEFQGTMTTSIASYGTRLSSAGLVYKHFGMEVIKKLVPELSAEDAAVVYDCVYKYFVEHIDGGDNGVAEWRSESGEKLVRNYRTTTSLAARVGNLHPRWNQESSDALYNKLFVKAMEMVEAEFLEKVDFWGRAWLPARAIVQQSLQERLDVHPSGKIMKLKAFCPWMEHLFDLERLMKCEGQVLYVLFADVKAGWRVRAVGVEGQSYENRKSLPWKGLRDDELSKEAGIPGCVFVHASGFIGGHQDYQGALKMATKALEL